MSRVPSRQGWTPGSLPESAVTVEGYLFRPREPTWRVISTSGLHTLHIAAIPAPPPLRMAIAAHLLESLRTTRSCAAVRDLSCINGLLGHVTSAAGGRQPAALTAGHVISYDASRPKGHRSCLDHLKWTLVNMRDEGVGGMSPCLVAYLPLWRLDPHVAEHAVRTLSETHGALDAQEQADLWLALEVGLRDGTIRDKACNATRLILATGVRPLSVAVAKVKDLRLTRGPDGAAACVWAASILKQRNVPVRARFQQIPLDARIGQPIMGMCARSSEWAVARGMPPGEAPIFLAGPHPQREGMDELAGYEGHMGGAQVAQLVEKTVRRLAVHSERTGEALRAGPLRLRRTNATEMSEAGAATGTISASLGQSCSNSSLIYTELGPRFVARIDAAIGPEHAALAARFMADPGRYVGQPTRERRSIAAGGQAVHRTCGAPPPHASATHEGEA